MLRMMYFIDMKHLLLFVLTLLSASLSWAQRTTAKTFFETHPVTQNANVGLLIVDVASGEVIDAYREHNLLPTASTMKVVSTCTALELLGPDFRWSTFIETDGTLSNGVLNGNLYIRGTGDPTLMSEKVGDTTFMQKWVKEIQKSGIRQIDGAVIADLSMWDNNDAANGGWTWEDIGNYYGMGVFPLNYYDNTMKIYFRTGENGSIAQVEKTIPDVPGMHFRSSVRCCKDVTWDDAYVQGIPFHNFRQLTGRIPANRGLFSTSGDIPNPGLLLAQHLTTALKDAGIMVKNHAEFLFDKTTKQPERTLIYEHHSPKLSDVIYETNQSSNNLYAESIFRTLGAQKGLPATVSHSRDVVEDCWKTRGVDFKQVFQYDGCGLAPQNGIAPATFVSLLRYMYTSSNYPVFFASLPISGKTGTGKYFLAKTRLENKVFAKSGSIAHLKSYTGYIHLDDGRIWAFSVVVNNGDGSGTKVRKVIENYLLEVTKDVVR